MLDIHRPDLVAGAPVYLDGYRESNAHQYINRQAFADPCDVRNLRRPCGIFGNLGGFLLDNPGSVFYDMSVFKNFAVGRNKRLQFRWEVYNLFNQVNWSAINTNAQFNPAGQQVNLSFGQATAARSARVMQGALRFSF